MLTTKASAETSVVATNGINNINRWPTLENVEKALDAHVDENPEDFVNHDEELKLDSNQVIPSLKDLNQVGNGSSINSGN